jgi:hypothetical protein
LTTFPNDEGYDELVLARHIPVRSVCEHHLLPFFGMAHVDYLPDARILGLSKVGAGGGASRAGPRSRGFGLELFSAVTARVGRMSGLDAVGRAGRW